jgi:AcrR family transcriptional regulator
VDESSGVSGNNRRRAAATDATPAYRQRRLEIIQAAALVFKSKGFRGTSLGDIAAAANTDRATLYYYIGGKAELFDEAVSGAVEANALNAEAIRNGPEPAPEKLRILIKSLMKSYADNYPLLYIFIQEHLGQVAPQRTEWSRRMRHLNRRYEDAIVGILRDGIDEGTIRPIGDPRIIAYGLLGMLGWTNRWFNPTDSIATYEEIGATFAAAFLDGVRLPPAESR